MRRLIILLFIAAVIVSARPASNGMKTSDAGIKFIQRHESCRLTAYKPREGEKMCTIGWGHYGVKCGTKITQREADQLFKQDLVKFENAVNDLGLVLNQNQFDALVSFAYNLGPGNLRKLCNGRSLQQIAEAMTQYNRAGKVVYSGLTKRREEEKAMFLSKGSAPALNKQHSSGSKKSQDEIAREIKAGKWGNGEDRRRRLRAAGYTDSEIKKIQVIVNRLVKKK